MQAIFPLFLTGFSSFKLKKNRWKEVGRGGVSSFHHRKILVHFWPRGVCTRASAALGFPLLPQRLCGQNRKTAEQEQKTTAEGAGGVEKV